MLVKQIMMTILILSITFSLSYWILISSEGKEAVIQSIGKILGGSIIILAIIASSISYYLITECNLYNSIYSNYMQYPIIKQNAPFIGNKQLPPAKALKTTKAK